MPSPPPSRPVAVTLNVLDGLLAGVHLGADSPDFAAVAAALNGRPATLGVAALAAHVRAAVPFGVELAGTTPEAIAVAVRSAVDAPTAGHIGRFTPAEVARFTAGWAGYPWRILPERPFSPALNVALDEVLTDRLANGLTQPTLRFWGWDAPAVVLGRTQSVANEVDLDAAVALGVTVVRRISGGGAMFVQPRGAITYSLTLPDAALAGLSVRASYEVCEAWVIEALRELGVDAHHVPINDIACADGKIGGAAQARRGGVVLHHTTIAYDIDSAEMARVLRIGRAKLRPKGTASAAKRVSPLARQTGLSREAVVESLRAGFVARYGGTAGELSPDELTAAQALVVTKYAADAWTREFE